VVGRYRAQSERMWRIGVLMNTVSDDGEGQARLAAFHQGLQQLGWTVGHNVRIDYRWGGDDAERIRRGAAELVALGPDVILASGTPSVAALLQATDRIPVVFAQVADPVGAGFVESLARHTPNFPSLRFLLPRPDANCDVTRADGACSDVQGTELLGLDFPDSIIIGDAGWTILRGIA
jgi:hypothetical protein